MGGLPAAAIIRPHRSRDEGPWGQVPSRRGRQAPPPAAAHPGHLASGWTGVRTQKASSAGREAGSDSGNRTPPASPGAGVSRRDASAARTGNLKQPTPNAWQWRCSFLRFTGSSSKNVPGVEREPRCLPAPLGAPYHLLGPDLPRETWASAHSWR